MSKRLDRSLIQLTYTYLTHFFVRALDMTPGWPLPSWCGALFRHVGAVAALFIVSGAGARVAASVPMSALDLRPMPAALARELISEARQALWLALQNPQIGWSRIHAAETLAFSGDTQAVRDYFLSNPPAWENSPQRVGAWRVLAATAQGPTGRDGWVDKIKMAAGNHAAADRLQAIEALGKLGYPATRELASILRDSIPQWTERERLFLDWTLHLAGDRDATLRLLAGCTSKDAEVRRRVAYIVRRLQSPQPEFSTALLAQFHRESADTVAYPYLLTSSLILGLSPLPIAQAKRALSGIWRSANGAVRLEISPALAPLLDAQDLASHRSDLKSPDTALCIATASLILRACTPTL